MSFTTLYAELVVVGTGAMTCVLLFFYAFFGDSSWFSRLKGLSLADVAALIPVLSVIYLLGIVIANISYLLFAPIEKRLQRDNLKEFADKYQEIRNELYTASNTKDLVEEFEFRRSKVRICRGWFVNCLLIIVALATCSFEQKIRGPVTLFWILCAGLLMIGTAVSWWTATTTELEWFSQYARKLTRDASVKETTSAPVCF